MKKSNFLVLLFALIYTQILAQTNAMQQVVRGKIIDKETQQPIPGAIVLIANTQPLLGVSTDAKGFYRIDNCPLGQQQIVASYIGYAPFKTQAIVNSGKEMIVNIELEENYVNIKEVEIKANNDRTKPNNEMATVSAREFSVDEANRYAGSFNDPARMAANYAGVSLTSDIRNDIVVRGNAPSGILWRLDGFDIPNPSHFSATGIGGAISILNNNFMANSNFYTSAFPAEYNNALSGVFDIKMRNGNNEKHEFTAQVGFNGFEGNAEGPISKKNGSSYMVGYRYSVLSVLKKLGINYGTTSVPEYQDLTFKLFFPFAKGSFSWFTVGGIGSNNIYGKNVAPTDFVGRKEFDIAFKSNMGVSACSFNYNLTPKSYLRCVAGVTYDGSALLLDTITTNATVSYRNEANNRFKQGAHTYINTKQSARLTSRIGLIVDNIGYNSKNTRYYYSSNTAKNLFDVKGNALLVRAYAENTYKLSATLTANTGLSYMHFLLNNTQALEPRVGITWQASPLHKFGVGYGLHSKLQELPVYFIKTTAANGDVFTTNKGLKPTQSHQTVLSYDWNINEHWRLKSEVYYQWLRNAPIEQSATTFSMLNAGADLVLPYIDSLVSKGIGRNYGAEITLERSMNKGFYAMITGSVFKSEYKASDNVWRKTAFSSDYVANCLVGKEWKFSERFTLTSDIKYTIAGGRRYSPVDTLATQLAGYIVRNNNDAYSQQYQPYQRLDIRVGFRQNFKHVAHELAISLTNVTNNKNIFGIDYNPKQKTIYYTYQLTFVPILLYRIYF
jgi:hypothetical protein